MNLTEQIKKISDALRSFNDAAGVGSPAVDQKFNAFPRTPEKLNFSDYILSDGTTLRVDGEIAVGSLIYVVNGEEILPAPDGVHEIPEVGSITTQGGAIVAVDLMSPVPGVAPEIPVAANDMDPLADQTAADVPVDPMIEKLDAIENKLNALYDMLMGSTEEMKTNQMGVSNSFAALDQKIEKILTMPTADPIKTNRPQAIQNGMVADKNNRLKELTNVIKNLK